MNAKTTIFWQRIMVFSVILIGFLVCILLALSWGVLGWPDFPKHRTLDIAKYTERTKLLKYLISLSFSVIGATWYLACIQGDKLALPKRFYTLLSWTWTFLGISVLTATAQIYFTYKDLFHWQLVVAEGYTSKLQHIKHCAALHILHLSYRMTDYFFFLGAFFLIMVLLEVLHVTNSSNHGTNVET